MAKVSNVRSNPVYIMLDKVRILKFDLNAFEQLEKKFGSVELAMTELEKGGMGSIKIIVWTGLIHQEAIFDEITGEPISYNITPYQVGSWLTPSMLEEVSEKLALAMQDGLPDETKKAITIEAEHIDSDVATVVKTPEEIEAENEKNV